MPSTGSRLKELRLEKNKNQTDIATLLEVSLRQLQRYEKDQSELPLNSAIILADYYEVTLDYLIGRSNVRRF